MSPTHRQPQARGTSEKHLKSDEGAVLVHRKDDLRGDAEGHLGACTHTPCASSCDYTNSANHHRAKGSHRMLHDNRGLSQDMSTSAVPPPIEAVRHSVQRIGKVSWSHRGA